MLASFLPLLRECIPTAAEEIEADIQSSHNEEYVYDYYAVNEEMDISEDSTKNQFPLCVFVFAGGPLLFLLCRLCHLLIWVVGFFFCFFQCHS